MPVVIHPSKKDSLGDRMKARYEDRWRFMLPVRTYTIIRADGRAFHTWTKKLERPYDTRFMTWMDHAAEALVKEISGARFAFVQSDEISVLIVDFENIDTEPWFDGIVQKIASVSASIATAAFNSAVQNYVGSTLPPATFDSRVFIIPDPVEVENYFIWRQKDAERNSVTMLAQKYFSHKQLEGKNTTERQELIHQAEDDWAKHPVGFKRGRVVRRLSLTKDEGERSHVAVDSNTPVFTRDRSYLQSLIPRIWKEKEGEDD
jgi:tRNA(His) 5'-end guanylyltransferase